MIQVVLIQRPTFETCSVTGLHELLKKTKKDIKFFVRHDGRDMESRGRRQGLHSSYFIMFMYEILKNKVKTKF